jgi:hypothetical protein
MFIVFGMPFDGRVRSRNAAELRALADRVRRNVPHRRDPERFHVEKSCVCQDLERLARRFEERPPKPELRVTRQRLRQEITAQYIGGRRVTVQRTRAPFAIFVGGNN